MRWRACRASPPSINSIPDSLQSAARAKQTPLGSCTPGPLDQRIRALVARSAAVLSAMGRGEVRHEPPARRNCSLCAPCPLSQPGHRLSPEKELDTRSELPLQRHKLHGGAAACRRSAHRHRPVPAACLQSNNKRRISSEEWQRRLRDVKVRREGCSWHAAAHVHTGLCFFRSRQGFKLPTPPWAAVAQHSCSPRPRPVPGAQGGHEPSGDELPGHRGGRHGGRRCELVPSAPRSAATCVSSSRQGLPYAGRPCASRP